jgi:hypothetical protein
VGRLAAIVETPQKLLDEGLSKEFKEAVGFG